MASIPRASSAQTVLLIPEEIWEEIFMRLDSAADLARASAACPSFHRIISAPRFLRRFGSLHSPPVLGFIRYGNRGFLPVGPPHSSAPGARALDLAADFTFAFLPDASEWKCRDARDGRVLLSRRISTAIAFEDFLVCDPLHRRYVRIPRIPDDLLASVAGNAMTRHVVPVLAPAGDENDGEESFRVICTVQHKGKVMVFIFSSCNQTWRGISTISFPNGLIEFLSYYAHGCLYWMFYDSGYLLMLDIDISEMEFSIIELPPHDFDSSRAIVEAEEGRLRFITIADGNLYCKNWQRNGVGAQELQHDKLIPLPKGSGINYDWEIDGIDGRYLALASYDVIYKTPNYQHFVLDIKTLLIEKLYNSNNDLFYGAFPYARFPPPLALPSI